MSFTDKERLQFAMEKLFIIDHRSVDDYARGGTVRIYDTIGALDAAIEAAGVKPREAIGLGELRAVWNATVDPGARDYWERGMKAVLAHIGYEFAG